MCAGRDEGNDANDKIKKIKAEYTGGITETLVKFLNTSILSDAVSMLL